MNYLHLLQSNSIKKYFLLCVIGFFFVQSCVAHSILFVCDKFPWYTKKATFNQIISLCGKGYKIDVWSQEKNVNKIDLDVIYGPSSRNVFSRTVSNTFYDIDAIDFKNYDVIICQYGFIGKELFALRREKKFNAKILVCFRGNDITSIKHTPNYKEDFQDADGFLPVCKYFAYLLSILGFPEEKIWVVPSAINIEHFSKNKRKIKEKIIITFLGRLIRKKGVIVCLKAFKEVLEKYSNAQLFIVGDGVQKDSLKKKAKKFGINKQIIFFGWLNYQDYVNILIWSDLVVMPSLTTSTGSQEGIANALKEAMAMKVPVVTTFHAGNRELIKHGKNGMLVPENSVYNLVKVLRKLIKDPDKRKKIGKAARKVVEKKFSLEAVGKQLDKVLQEVLSL